MSPQEQADGLILQVKKVHFDTREEGGPQGIAGLEPRHAPILHTLQGKGSVDRENARHVSGALLDTKSNGGWKGVGRGVISDSSWALQHSPGT